jgi:hypothetical protein
MIIEGELQVAIAHGDPPGLMASVGAVDTPDIGRRSPPSRVYSVPMVTAQSIREFMARDWDAVARAKREHWADVYQRDGYEAVWAAGQSLREHMRAVDPLWPTSAAREADLADHLRQKQLIDRVAHALAGR